MKSRTYAWMVRVSLLIFGGLALIIGINRGETLDVMRKAILICLECIGIG